MDFTNLQTQYQLYKNEINAEIQKILDTSSYIGGESISRLERGLEEFCNSANAIACSSGTDAIILALSALGIGAGDEVITTPFTFIATAEAIAFLGAKPVFVDIDPQTYNLDPSLIEKAITSKTKAILPASLYGQVCEMDEINAIAQKYNLAVIEDGAQSFGATYKGRYSCTLSLFATTSFFPSKPLGGYGDGGAVFVQDEDMAQKIRSLLSHGQVKRYVHRYIGMNARMDSLQASILCVKLKYFRDEIKKREKVAKNYTQALQDLAEYVKPPYIHPYNSSVFAQYSIYVQNRHELREALASCSIPTAIHYPTPLHLQEAFAYLGYKRGDFPVSENVSKHILSLPMSAFITEEEQNEVVEKIREFYSSK